MRGFFLAGLAALREIIFVGRDRKRSGEVEIKSVEAIAPVHQKQLLTHLRLAGKRLGLLINFNLALIKEGITRIANGMPD
jgi:PD-(D/E)XK nuclease superfamily protein